MAQLTFEQWLAHAAYQTVLDKHQRFGQSLFNYLHAVRPDLADAVRETAEDPFYAQAHNDERVERFLSYIMRKW